MDFEGSEIDSCSSSELELFDELFSCFSDGFDEKSLKYFLMNLDGSSSDSSSELEVSESDELLFDVFLWIGKMFSLTDFSLVLKGLAIGSSSSLELELSEFDSLSFDIFFCSLKLSCSEDWFLCFEGTEMRSLSSLESEEFCFNFFEKVLFCFEYFTKFSLDKEEIEFAFSSSLSEIEVLR